MTKSYSAWNKFPFVRFTLPLSAGIILTTTFNFQLIQVFSVFLFCFCTFILTWALLKKYRYALWQGLFLNASLLFLGATLNVMHNEKCTPIHYSSFRDVRFLIAQIDEQLSERKKTFRCRTVITGIIDSSGHVIASGGNLLLYLKKDSLAAKIKYGDVLLLNPGNVQSIPGPSSPYEYDFRKLMDNKNIHYQLFAKYHEIKLTGLNHSNPLIGMSYQIQGYFKKVLSLYVGEANATAVAQALLYGDDDNIDPETVKAFADTGTLHVLAVSGMHVGLIFVLLSMILRFKGRNGERIKNIFIIILLWTYTLLCGMSPSILRATVMFSFILLGKSLNRRSNIFNTMAVSIFLLQCVDPRIIFDVGFQLSYMAVGGIIIFHPYIHGWFEPKSRLISEIWTIVSVSIAAQITTFPMSLYYFHQFPNCFLFSNLIVIPLTTLLIYIGILLLVVSGVHPLALMVGKVLRYGIEFTNSIVSAIDRIPFAYSEGIYITSVQLTLLFIAVATLTGYFLQRKSLYMKICMSALILFGIIHLQKIINNQQRNEVIVFHSGQQTALGIIQCNHARLLLDSLITIDTSKLEFHVLPYFRQAGIPTPEKIMIGNRWIRIQTTKMTILISGEGEPSFHGVVDLLVIRSPIIPGQLSFRPKLVVLTGTLKKKERQRIEEELYQCGIEVLCTEDKGLIRYQI